MALRHYSFCELYKTNLCQFCSLRRALKMCSHSNYLFQRCSLKSEVRGKCLKQLYPTNASIAEHLPSIYSTYVYFLKIIRKWYTKFLLLCAITYSCTDDIQYYFYICIFEQEFQQQGWEAGMFLEVSPAVHLIPAVNTMGQSSVSALFSLLHSHQDVKKKEGDESQRSQPSLREKRSKKHGFWSCIFLLELMCCRETVVRSVSGCIFAIRDRVLGWVQVLHSHSTVIAKPPTETQWAKKERIFRQRKHRKGEICNSLPGASLPS